MREKLGSRRMQSVENMNLQWSAAQPDLWRRGEISHGMAPWSNGLPPKNENWPFLVHFSFEGPLSDLSWTLLSLGWTPEA